MMERPKQTATRRASRQRQEWAEYMKAEKRKTRAVRAFQAPRFNPGAQLEVAGGSVDLDAERPTPVVELAQRVEARLPTMAEGGFQKTEPQRGGLLDRAGTIYRT